ncbi:MAG: transglutaminase [Gammaproteobacteria bacterium]|nr:MAG: transglutaminase [Gammaproteobacteria bacterium]
MSLFGRADPQRKAMLARVKNPALQARPLMLLMAVIAITALPHFFRLPVTISALIGGALGIKLLMLWRGRMAANRLLLLTLTLGTAALVFVHYGTFSGHEAGSALLLGMLALKLLEAKNYRDAMIASFLAYFLTAVNFLFTQSIPTAVWMPIQVALITFCLISMNQIKYHAPLRFRAKLAVRAVLYALPMMLVMFVLFPRIPGPLWGIPKPSNTPRTGFSDSMSPGQFAELAQSGEVAFRVKFAGQPPPQAQLYWRGLTLWHYDGLTWNQGKRVASSAAAFAPQKAAQLDYTVTLEPHQNTTLFSLDMPVSYQHAKNLDRNYQLSAERPVTQVYQYQVKSQLDYVINPVLEPFEWRKGLQLPADYNPRTRALGQRWRASASSQQEIVNRALNFFHNQDFYYTLKPPPLGKHKADDFLFNTRRGFCEYYSNAFVILMRAAGVPARIVVGYMGGETNPINQNLSVRQSDAHAWAEVWLPQRGWVRVDPTAAVAPERIEENLNAALGDAERADIAFVSRPSLLKGVINLWDAANNSWNQWVLGYGPKFQKAFLARLGLETVTSFIIAMLVLLGIVLAVVSYSLLRPARRDKLSAAQVLFQRFCQRMGRAGLPRHPHETATAYATRLAQQLPDQQRELIAIAETYNCLQYRGESAQLLAQFKAQLASFRAVRPAVTVNK